MQPENGPPIVYPGSHKGPVYNHHVDGVFAGAMLPEENGLNPKDDVSLLGPAGSISIHHGRYRSGLSAKYFGPRKLAGIVAAETMQFYMGELGTFSLFPLAFYDWVTPPTTFEWVLMTVLGV